MIALNPSVETIFDLEDRVSAKFSAMVSGAKALGLETQRVGMGLDKAFDPKPIEKVKEEVGKAATGMDQASKNAAAASRSSKGLKNSLNGASDSAGVLARSLAKGAVILYGMKKTADALRGFVGFSDEMAMIDSRLALATDGSYTLAQAQDLVMRKAKETKSDYMVLADTVGRIGIAASDAFKDTKEVINFAGALNQSFMLAGASAEEVAGSTRQLTQALASGVLRGDELNSVMEGAPLIAEALSKKLGITKGEIRELAAEGKITSDIVKEAVLENADEINRKFQKMNGTLGGTIKNGIKNNLVEAFREPAAALNDLFNSDSFATAAGGLVLVINGVAKATTFATNATSAGLDFVVGHWEQVGKVAKWAGIIVGTFVLGNFVKSNWAIIKGLRSLVQYEMAVGIGALRAWAMASGPFLLAGAAIMGLILILGKCGLTFEDVAGIAVGAFGAIGAVGKNVAIALAKVWGSFFDWQMKKLKWLLLFTEKVASAVAGKKVRFDAAHNFTDFGDSISAKIAGIEFASVGDAWKNGSKKGKDLWNNVTNFKNPMSNKQGSAQYRAGVGLVKDDDESKSKLGKIKDNTDTIKKSLSDSIENLTYLTKQALTQRVTIINNTNKLEVKNEFNNPDSSLDVDGIGTTLGNSLLEAINSGNGGVPEYV